MEIKGQVPCFFEQSGTFKNEFIKLGYEAYDYDIQDNFGETDFVIDLFGEIDRAYNGGGYTVFDKMTEDDLIIAFFPCIYFCEKSQYAFYLANYNYRNLSESEKIEKILQREKARDYFYTTLIKFVGVCIKRGIRMIFENPYTQPHFLTNNFVKNADVVDKDRSRRGDFRKKPTQYWFFNCEPTHLFTHQQTSSKDIFTHDDFRHGSKLGAGHCGEGRSAISPDYARNWICDFVLGKDQHLELTLFDF